MTTEIPALGTPEREWWLAGASAEAEARRKDLTADQRSIYETVEAMAENADHYDAARMVWMIAVVFTCEWTFRDRLRLARKLLTNGPGRRLTVYREPADLWVGYYRGDDHHYVCPLPTLVIRWERRKKAGQSS